MKDRQGKQTGRRLCAYARRTLTAGHLGLLLCLCCLWILLDSPLRGEALRYAEVYAGSVGGYLTVLWGAAWGMELSILFLPSAGFHSPKHSAPSRTPMRKPSAKRVRCSSSAHRSCAVS